MRRVTRTFSWKVPGPIPIKRRFRGYTPKATVEDERRVRDAFEALYGRVRSEREFQVSLYAYCAVPARRKPWPRLDVDNFAKAVLDALNKCLWEDDDQVTGLFVFKHFNTKPEEEPGPYSWIEAKEFA